MNLNFFKLVTKKTIIFAFAGAIGALAGGIVGEIPFLATKNSGVEISENILETQKRVKDAGGKTGEVQASLLWNNKNDLDLHVIDPMGEEIYFSHKTSNSGGELDVDRNISGETNTPVENVVWVNTAPLGEYSILVSFFGQHDNEINTPFTIVVKNAEGIKELSGVTSSVKDKQLIHKFNINADNSKTISSSLIVGIWGMLVSLGIALSIALGQRKFLKQHLFAKKELLIAVSGGTIAGLTAAILANYLFIFALPRAIAWGLMGLLLGTFMTRVIPNLSIKSGAIGGIVGGTIGGILFTIFSFALDEMLGRILGAVAIGFFIGLMISLIEEILREAWLTVEWNSNEKANISLGEKPIILGSSAEADIYLPKEQNFPPITAIMKIENGKLLFENKINNQITELENGKKIQLGTINILVHIIADINKQ